jgi:hypothetical protein
VIVGYLIAASQNFNLALFIMAMHGFVAIATHIWMTGKLQRLAPVQ